MYDIKVSIELEAANSLVADDIRDLLEIALGYMGDNVIIRSEATES